MFKMTRDNPDGSQTVLLEHTGDGIRRAIGLMTAVEDGDADLVAAAVASALEDPEQSIKGLAVIAHMGLTAAGHWTSTPPIEILRAFGQSFSSD